MVYNNQVLFESLKSVGGTVIKEKEDTPLTFKRAICTAVTSLLPEEQSKPDGEARYKEYKLALQLDAIEDITGTFSLTAEQIALIKKKAAVYSTDILGRIWDMLEEGKTEDKTSTNGAIKKHETV